MPEDEVSDNLEVNMEELQKPTDQIEKGSKRTKKRQESKK